MDTKIKKIDITNNLSPSDDDIITQQKNIIQEHLTPELDGLFAAHHKARFEWFPSELLPASKNITSSEEDEVVEFRKQCHGLPDSVRVALVLNLLTEEGLPSYHRMLHEAFGDDEGWRAWANQWTAEEDRHGNILRDVMRDTRLVDFTAVEKMQFDLLKQGWAPDWSGNAYRTIAYTSFQERATQVSHRNLGKIVRPVTAKLGKIFACIAGDESRHYKFYASMMKKLLLVDTKPALEAILATLKTFKMPGHELKGFSDMAIIEHAVGIFGPKEFSEVITDVVAFLGLDKLTQLDDCCEDLRQKILAYPARLLRMHNKFIDRVQEQAKGLRFSFL